MVFRLLIPICSTLTAVMLLAVRPASSAELVSFAEHVAPVFAQRCVSCHGSDEPEGGLQLVSRGAAFAGGKSGRVIVPGDSAKSLLVVMVSGTHEDGLVMPPEGDRLTDEQVAMLRRWIDEGADWPEAITITDVAKSNGAAHWAYQPIVKPAFPEVRQEIWVRQPLDRFVLHRLESQGISPSAEAEKAAMLRRVTLDLIGLLPSPEEVQDYLDDESPDAYERVVDRLLQSPHYGERWARPWLDLCHFAESDGYLTDQLRPVAWRYRDWLVDALNRDMPFDQFTKEQLAGDLLPDSSVDQQMATGFLRQTLSDREGGADLEESRVVQVLDRTVQMGTVWLGLTIGCAQCHDHKFDLIRQKEFYGLHAFFDSADEVNIDAPLPGEAEPYLAAKEEYERQRRALIDPQREQIEQLQKRWEGKLLEASHHPGQDHVWDRMWEVLGLIWGGNLGEGQLEGTQIVKLEWEKRTHVQQDRLLDYFLQHGAGTDPGAFTELKLGELSGKLTALMSELPKITRAPIVRTTQIPRELHLFKRGDFRSPGGVITPATPDWLPPLPKAATADRLALAEWLTSKEHPLSSRVAVNRAWQEFFGRGLVFTSGDFGDQGEMPTHPELLDWLAWQFREQGWSNKQLHRNIVTSATYRQASDARPELSDPDNRLLARQASLRISAEQVRDATLAASGLLSKTIGGPSVFPPQPDSVGMEGFDVEWKASEGEDRFRRGLYTFTRRQAPFAQSVTFDGPDPSQSCTLRQRSNTPLQALTLLNDPVFFEAARALAARVLRTSPPGFQQQLEYLFLVCLSRSPTADESDRLTAYWHEQVEILKDNEEATQALAPTEPVEGTDPGEAAAWTGLCSVVLNLHEFITRE